MKTIFLLLVAGLLLSAALAHSWMGERQIVRPVLEPSLAASARLRLIVRVAWHVTSVLLLVLAVVFVGLAVTPLDPQGRLTIAILSSSFFLLGVTALFVAGPRHIAWPLMLAVSAVSALALL